MLKIAKHVSRVRPYFRSEACQLSLLSIMLTGKKCLQFIYYLFLFKIAHAAKINWHSNQRWLMDWIWWPSTLESFWFLLDTYQKSSFKQRGNSKWTSRHISCVQFWHLTGMIWKCRDLKRSHSENILGQRALLNALVNVSIFPVQEHMQLSFDMKFLLQRALKINKAFYYLFAK